MYPHLTLAVLKSSTKLIHLHDQEELTPSKINVQGSANQTKRQGILQSVASNYTLSLTHEHFEMSTFFCAVDSLLKVIIIFLLVLMDKCNTKLDTK